jgi:hypothetical protein
VPRRFADEPAGRDKLSVVKGGDEFTIAVVAALRLQRIAQALAKLFLITIGVFDFYRGKIPAGIHGER